MRYLLSHWRGHQGLAWSFWVNLVLLRAVIFALQDVLFDIKGQPVPALRGLILGLIVLAHLIVFVWQVVGVLRACVEHLRNFGSVVSTWGAQLGLIIALLYTGLYVMSAWHSTRPAIEDGDFHQRMLDERATRYRIETPIGSSLTLIAGTLELGIADAFRSHLENHPGIQTIALDSDGGNLYQARALARTIRENGLDTQVTGRCSSACTVAFIGGRQRLISKAGQLGFHQYRTDANYLVPFADLDSEQQSDRELYASAGVSANFLVRMFTADAQSLWFPSHRELIEARVVTGFID